MTLLLAERLDMIAPDLPGVEYGVAVDCPKCGSKSAWFERDSRDVHLRCLCGLMKLVATTIKDVTIEHVDSGDEVSLPRQGSKLWNCLAVLHSLQQATTVEITAQLNAMVVETATMSVSDVASQLTVLKYKGLVRPLENRRGHAGGSTWLVTDPAKKLMGG